MSTIILKWISTVNDKVPPNDITEFVVDYTGQRLRRNGREILMFSGNCGKAEWLSAVTDEQRVVVNCNEKSS